MLIVGVGWESLGTVASDLNIMKVELGWMGRENPSDWRETSLSDESSTSDPAWMTLLLNPDLRSEKPRLTAWSVAGLYGNTRSWRHRLWMNLLNMALCYKPQSRGFNSPRNNWDFSFQLHSGSVFDSACNRNEYQRYLVGGKGGQCVQLTALAPSCADCLEILETSHFWSLKGLSKPVEGLLYLLFNRRGVMTDLVYIHHFQYVLF